MKSFIFCIVVLFSSNVYANSSDWIPYIPQPVILQPPVVEVPLTPSVTYSNVVIQKPLVLTYDWVPYTVNKTILVEKCGLFCKYRYFTVQPTIEWVYQPVWR